MLLAIFITGVKNSAVASYCAGPIQPFSSTNELYVRSNVQVTLTCSLPGNQVVWLLPGVAFPVAVIQSSMSVIMELGTAMITLELVESNTTCLTARVTIAAEHVVDAINTEFTCQDMTVDPTLNSTVTIKNASKELQINLYVYYSGRIMIYCLLYCCNIKLMVIVMFCYKFSYC